MHRLLFAGDFRWNSGSSHVVAEYSRVAQEKGAEVRVALGIGSHDSEIVKHLRYERDLSWATHIVFVLEGNPFLNSQTMEQVDRCVPSHRRLVIDADGRLCATVTVGEDSNHRPAGPHVWKDQFELANSTVVQPVLHSKGSSHLESFSYFGMPRPSDLGTREVDAELRYVGANWWRFPQFVEIVSAYRRAAGCSGLVEVCGRWWDTAVREGHEAATASIPGVLEKLGVRIKAPVPFGHVVSSMSRATMTPVLVRPVLARLRLLTPRMLETLAASTIPIYRADDSYVSELIGDDGHFCLGASPEDAIGTILGDLTRYQRVAREIRRQVYSRYCYENVFASLLALLC